MSKSIKSNYIYNVINLVSSLLFPLIAFPYASRILLPSGVGQVEFYNSIISYIVLLSGIGIPLYGIREIARVRDDEEKLCQTTIELIVLNLFFNFWGYISVFLLVYTLPVIQVNIPLFLLLSSSILLTTIGCSWFYSGVEDFKFITIRGVFVKLICLVFLFIFVHDETDLMWYGGYSVLGSIGNYVVNFLYLRKRINLRYFSINKIKPFRHLKPTLSIFLFNIITSIYLHLDSVMVGFIKGTTYVGYYTAATKLSHMALSVVTSLGTVMLPRISYLIKKGDLEEARRLIQKAYIFVFSLSLPLCLGVIILSPAIIIFYGGGAFKPSILTLQIISPIIVAIGLSNLIGMQILYPIGKVKLVVLSTCVGAIVNFILNLILIPLYAQNGAAVATVFAEISVVFFQLWTARNFIPIHLFNKDSIVILFSSIIMACVCYLLCFVIENNYIRLFSIPIVCILVYSSLLYFNKVSIAVEIFAIIHNKISK